MSTSSTFTIAQPGDETDTEIILPDLREDIDLHEGPRSKDGSPTWTLHDPVRNKYFRIGWLEFEILARWDAKNVSDLADRVNRETTLHTTPEYIQTMLHFLKTNQLLRVEGNQHIQYLCDQITAAKRSFLTWFLHNYLFIRIPVFRPDRFLSATLPYIRFIYSRNFVYAFSLLTLFGIYLIMREWDVFQKTFFYFFSTEGLIIFIFAILLAKIVHELGHAYTAKLYGLKIPSMGVAFLVLWPVLYTDTSDAWKLPERRQRLSIAVAGMLAEIGLAGIATLLWSFLPDGPLRSAVFMVATTTWVITLLINSNPFLRFDGYYFLSDFLEIQNLQDRAFVLARWKLRRLIFGIEEPCPDPVAKKTMAIMIGYAYCTWIYRLVLFITIALLVYFLFFKVAGIMLMIVEIGWFIAKPITNEIKVWLTLRNKIKWNKHTITSVSLVGILLLFLVVPWNIHIYVPALLKLENHTQIYSAQSARIKSVNIKQGETVKEGQNLFLLESPLIEQNIAQSKLKKDILRLQLSRQTTGNDYLERRLVTQQQLAEAIAEYQGDIALQRQLYINAPFDGVIVELDETLTEGRWINDNLPLALLVNKNNVLIEAYLTENDLDRAKIGSIGRFYAENTDLSPIDVQIIEIDPTNTTVLDEPYHASIYGGNIAVSRNNHGKLIINETLYRILLKPVNDTVLTDQLSRGIVRITGTPESIIKRSWKYVSAVLLRESGF